jgi:putative ABC transport system permease protein
MLRTRWQKVIIDLWKNRARTLIVALAIAVGVYAVGVVVNVREMLVREYGSDQDSALVAQAIIRTYPFDDDLAERIAEVPGVVAAEGRKVVRARVYPEAGSSGSGPAGASTGEARDLILVAIPDFDHMQVDAITPLQGQWPPEKRQIILERLAPEYLGVRVGDTITVELDNDAKKTLTVVGTAHDAQQLSPGIMDKAYGYVTLETMGSLGLAEHYTELRIRVAEHVDDEAHIQAVVDEVEEQLERGGREVLGTTIITESYVEPFIDTIVLILTSFGAIILLLSGFLVVNAISALITQQVPQIGVMKLIGARRRQIMSLYIVTVLAYGVIAVTLGLPLAVVTARLLMTELVEGLLNVMPDSLAVSMPIILFQVAIGLLLPLVAGLLPVLKGTRITTHKALNDVGLQTGASGQGWVERVLAVLQKIRSVQRPVILAVRNTLRHKGRLAQTLFVLVVGTALFISVLSVWASVDATLESFMRFHRYDVSVGFERPYRVARVEQVARQVPGVVDVESWSLGWATRMRPDGSESDSLQVHAVPAGTALMAPEISKGHWLPQEAGSAGRNAIVVNSDVLEEEPDVQVGDDVVLDIAGREATWQVMGVVPTESRGPAIYVLHDDYAYATRTPGQATHVQVITQRHDADTQEEMETFLYQHFEERGFDVRTTETTEAINSGNELMFTIVVAFLVLMALLLAAVGGLGLTTTMSINIMERVREIGVLRAIGASNVSVRQIVLGEGIVIGLLSWGIGALLSLPISSLMSEQVGLALIDVPLSYQYSLLAAVVWFFALQLVAVVASLGPARSAVRLTIREVLAYE